MKINNNAAILFAIYVYNMDSLKYLLESKNYNDVLLFLNQLQLIYEEKELEKLLKDRPQVILYLLSKIYTTEYDTSEYIEFLNNILQKSINMLMNND